MFKLSQIFQSERLPSSQSHVMLSAPQENLHSLDKSP